MIFQFEQNIWRKFGETIRKTLFFESSYRYNFGLGFKDIKEVANYWKDFETTKQLRLLLDENNLINPVDEFNTAARIMGWLNKEFPSKTYYTKDDRDTWSKPLDTLYSLRRKKMLIELNPQTPVSMLKKFPTWKDGSGVDCDDYAILLYSLLRVAGVSQDNLFLCFMKTETEWHMNIMYFNEHVPYAIEGTYYPEKAIKNFGRTPYFNIPYYRYVRWIFNEEKVYRYSDKINRLN